MLIELKVKKQKYTISHQVVCSKNTDIKVYDEFSSIRLTSAKTYKEVMNFFKVTKIDVVANDILKKIVVPKQKDKFIITKLPVPSRE